MEISEATAPPPGQGEDGPALPTGDPLLVGTVPRLKGLARLRRLTRLRPPRIAPAESHRLFVLTGLIGAACGLAAVAFHTLIRFLERTLAERALSAPTPAWIVWGIVTPLLGGFVCGLCLQYFVPRARGSGVPDVKALYARRGKPLRLWDAAGKFLISALQIGSGASLGREGPTVMICATIASWFGRMARVSPQNLRRLLPVGAAAGIAAAFNAPIAAVTFTIEEIVGDLDKTVLSGVIVAAAIAAAIERGVLGQHPVFDLPQQVGLVHASSLLSYAVLGMASGLAAILFTEGLLGLRQRFLAAHVLPGWSKPAVGGALTGALAVAAHGWLGSSGIMGGGYATLELALAGGLLASTMLALCALKLAATIASYASGGAGGIFAPSLFIGGMLGGAIGMLDAQALGHGSAAAGSFALVGMGAFFAGAIRAPITSVLIIVEMTDGYSLILPLMIANTIAYGVAHRLRPVPIYEALLKQDGVHLRPARSMLLENLPVEKAMRGAEAFRTFGPSTLARDLVQGMQGQQVYPVIEDLSAELVGIITDKDLQALAAERGLENLVSAADIMHVPVSAQLSDSLEQAVEKMSAHGLTRLLVVDETERVLGFVDDEAIAAAYLREITRQRAGRGPQDH